MLSELRDGELNAKDLNQLRWACQPGGWVDEAGYQRALSLSKGGKALAYLDEPFGTIKICLNAHGTEPSHLAGRCWGGQSTPACTLAQVCAACGVCAWVVRVWRVRVWRAHVACARGVCACVACVRGVRACVRACVRGIHACVLPCVVYV